MGKKSIITLYLLCLSAFNTGSFANQYALIENSEQPLSNKVCVTCHGAYGQGNAVVGAPSIAGLEPWYLRRQLESFRDRFRGTETDYIPAKEMQDSVARLSTAEIDELVAFISTWEAPPAEATILGDRDHGAEVYKSCAACHGINAEGNEAIGAPGLAGRNDWYLQRQLKLFQSGYRGSHPEDLWGAQMRAAITALESEEDINDVLSYISQF